MTDFMELAAMAVANAQAEQKIRELADTQASLRRLAMLVARGEPARSGVRRGDQGGLAAFR